MTNFLSDGAACRNNVVKTIKGIKRRKEKQQTRLNR